MKVTLAQVNPIIGDYAGNLAQIEQTLAVHAAAGPDLVVFPELCLTGYPPRDLLERGWFIQQAEGAVAGLLTLSRRYPQLALLVGVPRPPGGSFG
jgi:NAD+ synthase (glutamine-hydrolysing)